MTETKSENKVWVVTWTHIDDDPKRFDASSDAWVFREECNAREFLRRKLIHEVEDCFCGHFEAEPENESDEEMEEEVYDPAQTDKGVAQRCTLWRFTSNVEGKSALDQAFNQWLGIVRERQPTLKEIADIASIIANDSEFALRRFDWELKCQEFGDAKVTQGQKRIDDYFKKASSVD